MRSSPTTRPVQPPSSHMLRLLFLCVAFLFLTVSEAVCNHQDQESLLWFSSNVSTSDSPLNWNPSIDCCSWEGITCDDSLNSHVTAISLSLRGLKGKLPVSVLQLHRLSQLNLSHNHLSGPLPLDFLSSLDQLTVPDLSYNSFTGPIPSFMCISSPQLSELDFSYNDFSGHIPRGLGRCLRLSVLRAGFNHLSGEIPRDIYNLPKLEKLVLPANHLIGRIDDDITQLRKLTCVELYSNKLEGDIPKDIGKLSSLQTLQLHTNNITGTLPLSLANCTNLVKLNLRKNCLEGTLLELDFSRLQSLSILDLGNNSFSGEIPWRVHSCKSLTAMRFASNMFTGQISPQVLELESLSFLSLSDNKLTNITGALRILQGCRNLSTLLIGKNFYNETFPSDRDLTYPDGFPNLRIFASGGSGLRGELPAWLIKLKSLAVLDLSQNQLVGSIPGWLGTLPHLFYIDLSDNLLSGELPKEFFQLKSLMSLKDYDATEKNNLKLPVYVHPNNFTTHHQYNQLSSLPPAIYIRRNNLKGSIPVEAGQLKALHALELSHNCLSGSIPDELSNLTNIERLDLSNNKLSGRIPWSLTRLHFMSYFNVANNTLQGPIPTGSQFDTFPRAHFEGNPLLFGGVLITSCHAPTQLPATTTNEEKLTRIFIVAVATGFVLTFALSILMLNCYNDMI
ncbi:Receptor-like protein 2 [Hirschfeldia incana]|nr:Receptor-like protein 2 [Hirschfeldia incana]